MSFRIIPRTIQDSSVVNSMFAPEKLNGGKWSNVDTGRKGLNTILDKEIIKRHLKTEKENMGKGFLRITCNDYDPKDPHPVNIGGRMMYPDENKELVIIDEAVVKKITDIEHEKREYIESLIERASLSDEVCQLILGLNSEKELKALLDVGGKAGRDDLAETLKNVNAMPSALETYDPTSLTYSQAIQKFKICIKTFMPVLQNLTPASTQNQEA